MPALDAQVPTVGLHVAHVQPLGQALGFLRCQSIALEVAHGGLKSGDGAISPRLGMPSHAARDRACTAVLWPRRA